MCAPTRPTKLTRRRWRSRRISSSRTSKLSSKTCGAAAPTPSKSLKLSRRGTISTSLRTTSPCSMCGGASMRWTWRSSCRRRRIAPKGQRHRRPRRVCRLQCAPGSASWRPRARAAGRLPRRSPRRPASSSASPKSSRRWKRAALSRPATSHPDSRPSGHARPTLFSSQDLKSR